MCWMSYYSSDSCQNYCCVRIHVANNGHISSNFNIRSKYKKQDNCDHVSGTIMLQHVYVCNDEHICPVMVNIFILFQYIFYIESSARVTISQRLLKEHTFVTPYFLTYG
uniref:Uncharacterized protein n=1 Tax=Rhizophagus irregularis (strain DAOM 181602 / DAOM 197198 / MUCL 43194) TaxID=747089 RepID=U9TTJ8_RHIID